MPTRAGQHIFTRPEPELIDSRDSFTVVEDCLWSSGTEEGWKPPLTATPPPPFSFSLSAFVSFKKRKFIPDGPLLCYKLTGGWEDTVGWIKLLVFFVASKRQKNGKHNGSEALKPSWAFSKLESEIVLICCPLLMTFIFLCLTCKVILGIRLKFCNSWNWWHKLFMFACFKFYFCKIHFCKIWECCNVSVFLLMVLIQVKGFFVMDQLTF